MLRPIFLAIVFFLHACTNSADQDNNLDFLENQAQPVREIVEEARTRIEQDDQDSNAWGAYGHTLHANLLLPEAISAYDQASSLDPDNAEWQASKAVALVKESRLEEASVVMDDVLSVEGRQDSIFLFFAGSIKEQLGEYDKALSLFESANDLAPESYQTNFAIGRILLNLGQFDRAYSHLQSAMNDAPRSAQIRNALLRLSVAKPDLGIIPPSEESADDFGMVTLPMPYFDKLLPYARTLEGLRFYHGSVVTSPDSDEATELLALINKHYSDQMVQEEWMDYAHSQASRGDLRGAEASYEECIKSYPDYANAYLGLADLQFMRNDLVNSQSNYEHAEQHASTNRERARVRQGFGRLSARAGALDESLEHMQAATNEWPESGLIHEDLARILADLGRYAESLEHLQIAERHGHQVDPRFKNQVAALIPQ